MKVGTNERPRQASSGVARRVEGVLEEEEILLRDVRLGSTLLLTPTAEWKKSRS